MTSRGEELVNQVASEDDRPNNNPPHSAGNYYAKKSGFDDVTAVAGLENLKIDQ